MFQRLLRPQNSLRTASSIFQKPTSLPRFQTRNTHYLPSLANGKYYAENGIPEFMSPEAFDFSWTQYQNLIIDKLNLLTQDTVDGELSTKELLEKYAKRPEMASLFNYASMAHNNHFFFNCLAPTKTEMPEGFAAAVADTCSSVESLKLDFLATASAMFGPGFVWLAKNREREGMLQILCTYNAGSPYPSAYARRQPVDMNTQSPDTAVGNQHAGSMGLHSHNSTTLAPGGLHIDPILCVNTWEHVWMMDYGIAGKDEYLERWWNRINWDHVSETYNSSTTMRSNWAPMKFRSFNMS